MYSEILSRVRTKREAEILAEEIAKLIESLYKTREGTYEAVLGASVRAWVASELKTLFAKEGLNKEETLRDLKDRLEKVKVLKLELAFEPTQDAISKIHEWAKANVDENILLDLGYNPAILAGTIITFKGKYGDYSLRKKLDEEFRSKKREIMATLSK